MKLRFFSQKLTGIAIVLATALATTATINQPSHAEGTTFYCGKRNNVATTFVRTQDGKKVPMVRWVSSSYFPPPWTAQRRCQEVSRRFQKNYDNGTLRQIKTGVLRGEPVVCAAVNQSNPCTDRTLLFTVKRGSNPNAIVRKLFDRRALAAGNALNESSPNPDINPNEEINIDVDEYLKNAPVNSDGDFTSEASDSTSKAAIHK